MNTKLHRIFIDITFALVFVIASCSPGTPAATLIPSPTSTSIPTPVRTIETLRADPNYMAGCEKINPYSMHGQASYKGIYPGHTTTNEVENILGKPIRIPDVTAWEYGDLTVLFDKSVVKKLFIAGDNLTTLKDMVLQHGCPVAIYALDINEEPLGEYARLLFIYSHIGFDFTIDSIPADLNEKALNTFYYVPGSLKYYSDSIHPLDVPNRSKPITWDEAVK